MAEINEVIEKEASLSIPLYVKSASNDSILELSKAMEQWEKIVEELIQFED